MTLLDQTLQSDSSHPRVQNQAISHLEPIEIEERSLTLLIALPELNFTLELVATRIGLPVRHPFCSMPLSRPLQSGTQSSAHVTLKSIPIKKVVKYVILL